MSAPLYAAIEGGGTKFVWALGSGPHDLRAEGELPTSAPGETVEALATALDEAMARHGRAGGLGLACFGPLDMDPSSASCGHIISTPKPGWSGFDIVGALREALALEVVFDTDVNGAALAEHRWGAARDVEDCVYVTVGTGIGGGILIGGRPVHGLLHPEMGHMLVARQPGDEAFEGVCRFHGGACIEGLASGPAVVARWGSKLGELPAEHPAWALQAGYLGRFAANIALVVSPQRIVLGGGVMHPALFEGVREVARASLNGYIARAALGDAIEDYLVPPALGGRAGVLGALALAMGSLTGPDAGPAGARSG